MSYEYSKTELKYIGVEPSNIRAKYKIIYLSGIDNYPKKIYSIIMYITDSHIYLREIFKKTFMLKLPFENIQKIKMCNLQIDYISRLEDFLENSILSKKLEIVYVDENNSNRTISLNICVLKKNKKINEFDELFYLLKSIKKSDAKTLLVKNAYLNSETSKVYSHCKISFSNLGLYIVPRIEKASNLFIPYKDAISITDFNYLEGFGEIMRQESLLELKFFDIERNFSTITFKLDASPTRNIQEHRNLISQLINLNIIDQSGNFTTQVNTNIEH